MNFKDLIKKSKVKQLEFVPIDLDQKNVGGGIYRMFDDFAQVIYVGKTENLHRRLLQHIGKDTNTAYFMDEVRFIEWYQEEDPIYQNLLEAVFIAYHEPKYNDEVKHAKRGAEGDGSL